MEYVKFIESVSDVFNIGYTFARDRFQWSYKPEAPEHENDRVKFNYLYYKDGTPNDNVQIEIQLMNWPHCKQYATFLCKRSGRYFVLTDQNDGTWDLQENLDNEEIAVLRRNAKRLRPLLKWIRETFEKRPESFPNRPEP